MVKRVYLGSCWRGKERCASQSLTAVIARIRLNTALVQAPMAVELFGSASITLFVYISMVCWYTTRRQRNDSTAKLFSLFNSDVTGAWTETAVY